jgi:hypothetical protein
VITRFFEGASFGYGFVREGCTLVCCRCKVLRLPTTLAPTVDPMGLVEMVRKAVGEDRCWRCGHVYCHGLHGEPLPGFSFLYAGDAPFDDVQGEPSSWNRWLRRDATTELSCVCGKHISVDRATAREGLIEAGWYETEHGWYCGIACARAEALSHARWKPIRRYGWWKRWGVNAWVGVGRRLTPENLPTAYGRG